MASSPKRSYRAGAAAALYAMVTMFLAVGAVNSQNNLLFIAFGIAVSAMIFSGLLSGAALMSVEVVRGPLPPMRVGEPCEIRYTVRNRGRFTPAMAIVIAESIEGERRHRVIPTALVESLPPGRSITVTGRFTPTRRGVLRARGCEIQSSFPFGLLQKSILFPSPGEVAAAPRKADLPRLVPPPADTPAIDRSTRVRRAAPGQEFVGVREYRPGDPARLISWRLSARNDALVVTRTAPSAGPSLLIEVLDPPADVQPHEIERALVIALAQAEAAGDIGYRVGLSIPWAGVAISPRSDPGPWICETLARVKPGRFNPGRFNDKTPRWRVDATLRVGFRSGDSADSTASNLESVWPDASRHPELNPVRRSRLASIAGRFRGLQVAEATA